MVINIFEGARRISLLIAGVAASITIFFALTNDPYISVNYSISHPNGQFVRMESDCPNESGSHYFSTKTQTGKSVSVDLCLLTMSFGKDNERLIPYRADDKGMVWGARPYSEEVSAYEKTLEARFQIPPEDKDAIEKEISKKYRESIKEAFTYIFYGLAIFWAIVWSIGWIVRGFLGIPRGLDKRPESRE